MAKYRPRKVDEVDAEFFIGGRVDAKRMIKWLDYAGFAAEYELYGDRISVQINPDDWIRVKANTWIVVDKDGNFKTLSDTDFSREYYPSETPSTIHVTGGSNMQFGNGNNQINHF